MKDGKYYLRRVRILIGLFMAGLVIAGVTAIPLKAEIDILYDWIVGSSYFQSSWPGLTAWISLVHAGITEITAKYPFLAYGTDWLAFGHFVIAVAFIGAWRNPVKNIWVIEFGMIACVLVVPFALVFGAVRGIPFGWRILDSMFGVLGFIPLWIARRNVKRIESIS